MRQKRSFSIRKNCVALLYCALSPSILLGAGLPQKTEKDFHQKLIKEYDQLSSESEFLLDKRDLANVGEIAPSIDEHKNEETPYYQVRPGDTLIYIAFKLYGDYKRWRELYRMNKHVIGKDYDITHLPILTYKKPLEVFSIPRGFPYLIKNGDSLSKISRKVYGDWRYWDKIYRNNIEQIPNPSLIFAGFTLYYPPLSEEFTDPNFKPQLH